MIVSHRRPRVRFDRVILAVMAIVTVWTVAPIVAWLALPEPWAGTVRFAANMGGFAAMAVLCMLVRLGQMRERLRCDLKSIARSAELDEIRHESIARSAELDEIRHEYRRIRVSLAYLAIYIGLNQSRSAATAMGHEDPAGREASP